MAESGSTQLRCNICGKQVSENDAANHTTTPSHSSLKAKLEENLKVVRKEPYKNDSSVILKWRGSV